MEHDGESGVWLAVSAEVKFMVNGDQASAYFAASPRWSQAGKSVTISIESEVT